PRSAQPFMPAGMIARPTPARSLSPAPRGTSQVPRVGRSRRVWPARSAGWFGARSMSAPIGASARPASARRAAPVEPQGPPVGTPVPVGAASTTGGSAGGIGGVFFFGLAALLAFAGLVRARVLFVLRRTPDAAWPQPFLALLERPG